MGIIAFNGNYNIPQPATLKEELVHKVHNSSSITGVVRRTWLADKYQVVLTFDGISISQYNVLAQYIFNQANPVQYTNAATGLNFTGFVTASSDTFLPGASFFRNVAVTIQQE